MIDFICATVITALLSCWVILFITEVGLREYIQVHAPKLISDLFACDFCLSWWLCLFFATCFGVGTGNAVLIFCAFCSTPITRYYL